MWSVLIVVTIVSVVPHWTLGGVVVDGRRNLDPRVTIGQSVGWREASAELLSTMDQTANPCQDFFQYACGKFRSQNEHASSNFDLVQRRTNAQVLKTLEELDVNDRRNNVVLRTVRRIMAIATAADLRSFRGADRLRRMLNENGGWPMLQSERSSSSSTRGDFWRQIGQLYAKFGLTSFLMPTVYTFNSVSKRGNELAIDIGKSAIGCGRDDDVCWTKTDETLTGMIAELANVWNVAVDLGAVNVEVQRMLMLERRIAAVRLASGQKQQPKFVTLDEAIEQWPRIGWKSLLRGWFVDEFNLQTLADEISTNGFFVVSPEFVTWLDQDLIPELTKDDEHLQSLQNYLMTRMVLLNLQFAGPEFSKLAQQQVEDMDPELGGLWLQAEYPMTKENFAFTITLTAPFATGRIYTDHYYDDASNQIIQNMTAEIKDTFRRRLISLNWLDETTKREAVKKLDNMLVNVGYSERQKNDTVFEFDHRFLTDRLLSISQPDLVDVITAVRKYLIGTRLQKCRQTKLDRLDWDTMGPTIVTAFYSFELNTLTLPASVLQPPFYHPAYPEAYNYAGSGRTIGHEITHGFDGSGINYDSDGTERTWMSEEVASVFRNTTKCVTDQFNKFCYPELNMCINGQKTSGENIADAAGVTIGYNSYLTRRQRLGVTEEPRLPGLEHLTMNQVFFLAYAHSQCDQESPQALRQRLTVNPHCPGRYRVTGSLRNNPAFANVWHCKPGDSMHPSAGSCQVW